MGAGVDHKSHFKEYMYVFAALAILTVLELLVPEVDASQMAKGAALVGLAVAKAFAVGYYYMHLKEEKAWLKFIAIIPISAAAYATVLILESLYR